MCVVWGLCMTLSGLSLVESSFPHLFPLILNEADCWGNKWKWQSPAARVRAWCQLSAEWGGALISCLGFIQCTSQRHEDQLLLRVHLTPWYSQVESTWGFGVRQKLAGIIGSDWWTLPMVRRLHTCILSSQVTTDLVSRVVGMILITDNELWRFQDL